MDKTTQTNNIISDIPNDISITIHDKKPSEQEIRYRFFGQVGITILCVGFSIFQLFSNAEEINATTLFGAAFSGLIMLYVKPPKLY